MADDQAAIERRIARLDRRTELIAALILSTATLASSYAGFQATLWDGQQASNYTMAEQARTAAATAQTIGGEAVLLDTLMFSEWLDAYARGDMELQAFYRARFRPDFARAVDQWLALRPRTNPAAPRSPFSMPAYAPLSRGAIKDMESRADDFFAQGQRANDLGDAYVQTTLIFSLALFMAGIIQSFKLHWLRFTLLGVSALCCAAGIARIASLPALRLTLGA